MRTQICKYCGNKYPLDFFSIASILENKVYRRKKCNNCYREMKNTRRNNLRIWFLELKKTLQCSKCGENRFYVLDFHHRDPQKKECSLGDMVRKGWSKDRIIKELEKCDVVCSNCHREIHFLKQ